MRKLRKRKPRDVASGCLKRWKIPPITGVGKGTDTDGFWKTVLAVFVGILAYEVFDEAFMMVQRLMIQRLWLLP